MKGRLGRKGDATNDSVEIIFQSLLQNQRLKIATLNRKHSVVQYVKQKWLCYLFCLSFPNDKVFQQKFKVFVCLKAHGFCLIPRTAKIGIKLTPLEEKWIDPCFSFIATFRVDLEVSIDRTKR